MKSFGIILFVILSAALGASSLRADDAAAQAILDKALQALGGEERLTQAKAFHFTAKGTIALNGNDFEGSFETTVDGLQHRRMEFEGEFGGTRIKVISVLNKNHAWRHYFDMGRSLNANLVMNEKQLLYIQHSQMTIVPLKGKEFTVESVDEDKVGDQVAFAVTFTGPDGKDFKLWFDKESGVPVKMVARVLDLQEREVTQETLLSDYQKADGLRYAAKIEIKRDGQPYVTQQIVSFKVLDKPDPKVFEEPR